MVGGDWDREAVFGNYAERPFLTSLDRARIWAYTDALSYAPGETACIFVNTNANTFSIALIRDGAERVMLFQRTCRGRFHDTPADCSVKGCNWPVALEIEIGTDWPSGAYLIETKALDNDSAVDVHHHLLIVRPSAKPSKSGRLLLIAATSTWTAYNDWGGSNHYEGFTGPDRNQFSPVLSIHRPLAKGFVMLPAEAPRPTLTFSPGRMERPRYPHMEWAYQNGFSKKYASAGWASYERHFFQWAEREGYNVDIISQIDLHDRPELLEGYPCIVTVGHDEYWSWEMRDAVDAYVKRGGRAARFAGNFMWQIRLEENSARQVCYKYRARAEDPLMKAGPRNRVTESWEAAAIGRPGAQTFGLNAVRGMYASWSGCSPRGAKGFPIYRPEHWAFDNTGLYYGDFLGAQSFTFGYEVDGLDYEVRNGLPYPASPQDVPAGLEILGLGLSSTIEEGATIVSGQSFLGTEDAAYIASVLCDAIDQASIEKTKRGCGMIVSFPRGRGEVFHAGSCEWVAGLMRRDEMVMQETRNVLNRYLV